MPTFENADLGKNEFVAFSLSGTANLETATLHVSWSRCTYGDEPLKLRDVEEVLILPYTKAGPADALREALYQLAEKL